MGLVTGCGDSDDQNLAEPRVIGGGGVGDGAINGRVNVHVVDNETDEPVGSAEISIGEPGEEPLEGLTDSSGLLTLDDGALDGPTTITVIADGYVAQTWFGANGANVTIPIDPVQESSDIPQAQLSGTIDGWADRPDPATDHFLIALIGYSQSKQLGDAANELEQPAGAGGLPGNACILSSFLTECDWDLNSRTGKVAVFATILDIDTKGTPTDDTDDINEVVGFAYKTVTVEDGVGQTGIALLPLEIGALTEAAATVASAPSGLDEAGVVFGVDTGDAGIMMVGFLEDPAQDTMMVPDLAGDFADASYVAYAFANTANDDDDIEPMSATLLRDLTDVSDVDFGDWMGLPTALSASDGEYSFTPVDGASLHVVSFVDSSADEVWGVALLDGRTTFTLPGLSPDPLPSGDLDLLVSAFDGDVDVQDFSVDDFQDLMDGMSRNREAFTH